MRQSHTPHPNNFMWAVFPPPASALAWGLGDEEKHGSHQMRSGLRAVVKVFLTQRFTGQLVAKQSGNSANSAVHEHTQAPPAS